MKLVKQILVWFSLITIVLCMCSCGKNTDNEPDVPEQIDGTYTFGDEYFAEICQAEDENYYDYTIWFGELKFNNSIRGTMQLGEETAFEANGFENWDTGNLTFYLQDGVLCLNIHTNNYGDYDGPLTKPEVEDYSQLDLSLFYGSYYSQSGLYEICLSESAQVGAFDLSLDYSTGLHDSGTIIPGVETTLPGYARITVKPQSDGTVHVILYSAISADGNFSEDLLPGTLPEVPATKSASRLAELSGADYFDAICEIEQNCKNMYAPDVINKPSMYSDGTVYRFPGKVEYAGDGTFLLAIIDEDVRENNLIVCYSDEYVREGEELCVYGTGIGEDTYQHTYYNGNQVNISTLGVNVGYIMRSAPVEYSGLTDYMTNFITGTYQTEDPDYNIKYMGKTLSVNDTSINGRYFNIDTVKFGFSRDYSSNKMGQALYLQASGNTTTDGGEEISVTLSFRLNKESLFFSTGGTVRKGGEYHTYYRVSDNIETSNSADSPMQEVAQPNADLPDRYQGVELWLWDGEYSNSEGFSARLSMLPTGTDFFIAVTPSNSNEEIQGTIVPGTTCTLDDGTSIVVELPAEGSIQITMNGETKILNAINS